MQGTVPEKRGVDKSRLRDKIVGAWYGRICGCSLGKPIEGVRNPELGILLRETGNYPMHRYIKRSDLSDELLGRVGSWLGKNMYADISECALADDDTNYTVLYQELIEKYGRDLPRKMWRISGSTGSRRMPTAPPSERHSATSSRALHRPRPQNIRTPTASG